MIDLSIPSSHFGMGMILLLLRGLEFGMEVLDVIKYHNSLVAHTSTVDNIRVMNFEGMEVVMTEHL